MISEPVTGGEPDQTEKEWFAVRVRSNCEWISAATLKVKGLDVCLPLCRPQNRSKSRNKETALFPGYVFARFSRNALLPVLTVPQVVSIVSCGRIPQAVDPEEMKAVQKLAASGVISEPYPYLAAGQRVLVMEGPLEGVEGLLVREKSQDRLVISVSLLMRSVTAEVDRRCVQPLAFVRPQRTYFTAAV